MKKLLVSAVALAMLAGCSSGGAASTANTSGGTAGKSVTIATDTDILSMNSSTSTDGTSFIALTMCEAGLTQLDEKNVPVSDLAEGYISKMVNSRNRINEKIIFLHVSNTEEICDLMHSFLD